MPRDPLVIKIELPVIEDLGIKLYGKLPPVVSEMVANSWDADAKRVDITLPQGAMTDDSAIVISDSGDGMSRDDMAHKYLRIGRKRRDEEDSDRTPRGRRVMGRKGIGKLCVFGVAKNVEVSTVKDGIKNTIAMKIDDMLKHASREGYEPRIVNDNVATRDKNGTRITLTGLKRKTPVNADSVRRDLAKHFSIIDGNFQVTVNGTAITPADKFRGDAKAERTWTINEKVRPDDKTNDWAVSGKILAMKKTLDAEDVGLTIMARGKLIQRNTTFGVKQGGKHTYSYITGEIEADFFDEDEDLISTNRQDVIWESDKGEALKIWGKKKLKEVSSELEKERKAKREKKVRGDPEVASWLEGLVPAEKKTANKIIGILTLGDYLASERQIEIVRYVKNSFEERAFTEMVADLPEVPESAKILDMFKTWSLLEAREMLRIVRGRLTAIETLEQLVKRNAKEVPDMHEYFKESPWILDPTWTDWHHELSYSKMLSEKYPEEQLKEKDRRIDFVATAVGNTLHVVELKRPEHKVTYADMRQLLDYVGFAKKQWGNHPERLHRDVVGYIVAGGIRDDHVTKTTVDEAAEHKRYVKTYNDLVDHARKTHEEFVKKLEKLEGDRRGAK